MIDRENIVLEPRAAVIQRRVAGNHELVTEDSLVPTKEGERLGGDERGEEKREEGVVEVHDVCRMRSMVALRCARLGVDHGLRRLRRGWVARQRIGRTNPDGLSNDDREEA
jgi:hypothetical protein